MRSKQSLACSSKMRDSEERRWKERRAQHEQDDDVMRMRRRKGRSIKGWRRGNDEKFLAIKKEKKTDRERENRLKASHKETEKKKISSRTREGRDEEMMNSMI